MGHRLEKNIKILEELISFCVKRGGRDINMNIKFESEFTVISLSSENTLVNDDDLQDLKDAIQSDRQHEVEECYWCISGEDYCGDELTLAGIMIDSGDVIYKNNKLEISAKRIED